MYAPALRETHPRLAPLFAALRDASSTGPEAARLWREISDRRAANMRRLAADLDTTGGMRPGLTLDDDADTIGALNSPEVFLLLTQDRAWTLQHYEHWLSTTFRRLLLE